MIRDISDGSKITPKQAGYRVVFYLGMSARSMSREEWLDTACIVRDPMPTERELQEIEKHIEVGLARIYKLLRMDNDA